jgi:hypothetical protein
MTSTHHLTIATRDGQALTPEQKRFNALLRRIEAARAELLGWDEQARLFAEAHAHRVRPLEAEAAAAQRRLALRLDELLAAGREFRWTKGERRTLREALCGIAADLLEGDVLDDARAAEMKALFDRHAETDYDTEQREAVAAMKQMAEAMSGVDLGDDELESEEDLLRRMHERMSAAQEAERTAAPPRTRKPTAAQRRREREAVEASQSLREVFRKLAGALHPDRAADDADRTRRTALMQRVNQAYEANDLLALFALQLEIEQVDAEHLARASAERARQYNRLLAEQLGQLEGEVEARRAGFCFEFGLDPFAAPAPKQFGRLLEDLVRAARTDLAGIENDLRQLAEPMAAKRWLRLQRRLAQHDMPF